MSIALRLLFAALLLLSGCDKNNRTSSAPPTTPAAEAESPIQATADNSSTQAPTYTGSRQCAECHADQYADWQDSHHDLAMQQADENTVLGDFDGSQFDHFGTLSRFYKKDGRHFVRTDGPDGALRDYPIAYTFGVHPLQQYLIELPGGRLQALSIAWDTRERSAGGQRWFHLYPDEKIEHGDALHWTGINQNWNFMCADCHSTNLQKNYDLSSDTFDTSWSEIDVGCEACHGPGSAHLDWARQGGGAEPADKGLSVDLSERRRASWVMDTSTGTARREPSAHPQAEINSCAQCHARRATRFPGARPGHEFLDNFQPALLTEGLYHADGQIDGEVYVYGSFLQSKMHAAGVTCSDCHQPHSTQLRADGNALCAQCHLPQKFDTAEHHFHPLQSDGAQCVNCHMPSKNYMVVDARHDHSFRIPRPDLSDKLNTPNACTGCHEKRSNTWAATALREHFGQPDTGHYGEAIHAGRSGAPGAPGLLARLIANPSQPQIARATAVSMLPHYMSERTARLLQTVAQGDSPLMSLGLARSLESVPEQIRPALAIPLLYEDNRVTAAIAASSMVGLTVDQYPEKVQYRFNRALKNYLESEKLNADRPESLLNIARLHLQRGNREQAEIFNRRALQLAPYFDPAYISLADLYRTTGREKEAESLLRSALGQVSDSSAIQHALGLSLVRQQRKQEALEYLRHAAEHPNGNSRYLYVYAIALNSSGKPDAALEVLEDGLQRFPRDTQIIRALISINREAGNTEQSRQYEQFLQSSS